jgi:hypothetical protein
MDSKFTYLRCKESWGYYTSEETYYAKKQSIINGWTVYYEAAKGYFLSDREVEQYFYTLQEERQRKINLI